MAILNFSTFLQDEANRTQLKNNIYRHRHYLLMLYSEYISWLKDITRRSRTTPEISVTDLLAQLKLIADYYLFLCQAHQNPKYLIKDGEILTVPEFLLHKDPADFNKLQPQAAEPSNDAKAFAQLHLAMNIAIRKEPMVFNLVVLIGFIIMIAVFSARITVLPQLLMLFSLLFAPLLMLLSFNLVHSISHDSMRSNGKAIPDLDISLYLPQFGSKKSRAMIAVGVTCCALAIGFIAMPAFANILLWVPALILPATGLFLLLSTLMKNRYQHIRYQDICAFTEEGEKLIDNAHQAECLQAVRCESNSLINVEDELKSAVNSTLCSYYATRLNNSTQEKSDAWLGNDINLDFLDTKLKIDEARLRGVNKHSGIGFF